MDLIVAAANGNIQRVQELLEYGADINIKNYDGDTVLIEASYRGYTEIVRLLLEKGADPNIKNRFEQTALMMASTRGYTKIVRLLLENGADPNIRNNVSGMTALDQALIYEHTDIVELLERHIRSTKIQSRFRGRQTRRKARTQKALQQLKASRLPVDYDLSKMIGERLSRMPYNPEVAMRIREERENKGGGKKKHKKSNRKKKPKSKQKSKTKKKRFNLK